jgi:hypothetical protein
LRTEAVSSKISDASDVAFVETDRSLDFRSAHLSHMSEEKNMFCTFSTDERLQKVAEFGVEPRKKDIQPDDYF